MRFEYIDGKWFADEDGVRAAIDSYAVIAHLKLARATLLTERCL